MDGNGRWAKSKGLPRFAGHKEGVSAVRRITEKCGQIGVKHLTLFTFSSENWNRPQTEVSALMTLLTGTLRKEIKKLNKNNVRFTTIGNISDLPEKAQKEIRESIEFTKNNSGLNLVLALNYSGKQEIMNATKLIAKDIENGKLSINDIDENIFNSKLYTHNIPEPDLLIRTGGDYRISNFMLWQLAYSEFYITPIFWPEFNEEELMIAIHEYNSRERRFGKTSEQVNND
ncbi:MAG: isoprenyl transferase [Candidatus Marinimicrobia bacterium]|nr:isoprenyl transferase [Candidatus Neomarinimicrobiota bacterium]